MTDLPTNQTAAELNKLLKLLENILNPIAQNAIVAAVPALGLPVVHQIIDEIETKLADQLTKLAETGVTFEVIDLQTDGENSSLTHARAALTDALQTGDKNAIQKALENLQVAQSALVNCDGSAPSQ